MAWSARYRKPYRCWRRVGVSEYLVDERKDTERAKSLLSGLQAENVRQQLTGQLAKRAAEEKAKTEAMWDKVVGVLKGLQ